MNNIFQNNYEELFDTEESLDKLWGLLLDLGIRGKLVPQDPNDEPANVLLEKIQTEREKLVKEKKIKKIILPTIEEKEIPFEIPDSWKWVNLQEIYDVRDGTHDTPKYVTKGVPLVTSKNIYNKILDLSNVKYISEEDHVEISKRSNVEKGDILFAMIGSIGNSVIVDIEPNFSIKNVALFKYYDSSLCNNKYLLYFLFYAEDLMKEKSQGGVQSFVSLTYLRNYMFPLPPLSEQRRIVQKLEEISGKIDLAKEKIRARNEISKKLVNAILKGI